MHPAGVSLIDGLVSTRAIRRYTDEPIPCLNRYRDPEYTEGANIYPACQNLLLAARAG